MLRGRLISCSACVIALVASPRETPGARLKDRFTTGNWPWWLIASGALRSSGRVKAESGTCVPPATLLGDAFVADVLLGEMPAPDVLVASAPVPVEPVVDAPFD